MILPARRGHLLSPDDLGSSLRRKIVNDHRDRWTWQFLVGLLSRV